MELKEERTWRPGTGDGTTRYFTTKHERDKVAREMLAEGKMINCWVLLPGKKKKKSGPKLFVLDVWANQTDGFMIKFEGCWGATNNRREDIVHWLRAMINGECKGNVTVGAGGQHVWVNDANGERIAIITRPDGKDFE